MSDSNSQTQQSTHQTDNRRVIGQNGISAEGSSVSVTTLDADVVNSTLSWAKSVSGQSAEVVTNGISQALGFGKDALKVAANANSDALAFAESNAKSSSSQAYAFAGDSLSASKAAFNNSLAFADKQTGRAFDSLSETESLVANAYADAKGRGALTDKILIGAIACMAVVALMAVSK